MGKLFFAEGAVGLASIANTEPGTNNKPFFSRSRRNTSYRSLSSLSSTSYSSSSPRSRCEELKEPHFLETCFLCKQHLGDNDDIFMYKGDTPFCSEECREKQIDLDEAKEKIQSLASSMKALKIEKTNATPRKSGNCRARTKAVVPAC